MSSSRDLAVAAEQVDAAIASDLPLGAPDAARLRDFLRHCVTEAEELEELGLQGLISNQLRMRSRV